MNVTTTVKIDSQTISDLIITAVEGGSNYWAGFGFHNDAGKRARLVDLPEDFIGHCTMLVSEMDDDGNIEEQYSIDLTKTDQIEQALARMADPKQCQPCHLTNIIRDDTDAETADVFMQLLTLGEIRYG